MASPPLKRRLGPERRRALKLLARNPHGATEEMLIYGHGLTRRMLTGLVRPGLATAERRVIMAGETLVEDRQGQDYGSGAKRDREE